jgi:phosphotriesterase-related protein
MAKSERSGKVQTVLGLIDGESLGITLTHEHLLFDGEGVFAKPKAASEKELAYQKVSISNLSWLRYHPYENLDNVLFFSEQEAIDEAMLYKKAGGKTIVDVTLSEIGRDPLALARISRTTGLNIVMGCGYYTAPCHTPDMAVKTEDELTEEIVRDVTVGVGNTGVRSGLIGEIGCSWPIHDNEKKALRAAARAQQITGACLTAHPGRNVKAPFEVVEILGEAGADINRVIMCHIDARLRTHDERVKLARTGCYLEYDLWGWEGHFPSYWTADDFMDLPNDTQRIYEVRQLIEEGYLNQILFSHDICAKSRRVSYGGWGLPHILNYAVPMMLQRGITREQIDTIMVENPKRLLAFV